MVSEWVKLMFVCAIIFVLSITVFRTYAFVGFIFCFFIIKAAYDSIKKEKAEAKQKPKKK